MTVRLVPADAAVQVKWVDESQEHRALESRVVGANQPEPVPQFLLDFAPNVVVVPFACRTTAAGKPWSLEGFVYREPVRATWEAADAIGRRSGGGFCKTIKLLSFCDAGTMLEILTGTGSV